MKSAAHEVGGYTESAVRAQLEDILSSDGFDASDRNRRFFRYVVEESLAGRTDRIKAYTIATVVFGRDESFDPQTDPIIRIEASRLRRALDHYYLTSGKDDEIRISIPKGSYVPVFAGARSDATAAVKQAGLDAAAPSAQAAPMPVVPAPRRRFAIAAATAASILCAWLGAAFLADLPPFAGTAKDVAEKVRHGPAVFVLPFQDDGSEVVHAGLVRGFTREVIVGLARHKDLFVFADQTGLHATDDPDYRKLIRRLAVDYVLTGGVTVSQGRFRASVALVDTKDGRHLWSEQFDTDLTVADILQSRKSIAGHVVKSLAQPYGIIFSEKLKAIEAKQPKELASYECVLLFHQYWRRLAADMHDEVRACLERTVVAEPQYAEAFASLATVYVDAYRFGYGKGMPIFAPLPRAHELASRAIQLAPDEAAGYKAMHNVQWFMDNVPASLEMAEKAVALNPGDPAALGDLGLRLYLTGSWERGVAVTEEAFARNPLMPSAYRVPLFFNAYLNGRYDEALAEAQKIQAGQWLYTHVMQAMAYGATGRTAEAAAAVKRVLAFDANYGDHVIEDLRKRHNHPRMIRAVVDGLRKAGLEVKPNVAGLLEDQERHRAGD